MTQEYIQARLAQIETCMDQMTAMLVEIKCLILNPQMTNQATSVINLSNSKVLVQSTNETLVDDKDPEEEILLKPMPSVTEFSNDKCDNLLSDRVESKGLIEGDKCFITHELGHQHFEKIMSTPKVFEDYKMLESTSSYEVIPTREDLVQTKKRLGESFREYAQRWKAFASRIKPAIEEDMLMKLFLRSLPFEYYAKLRASNYQSFTFLVKVGEQVEEAAKEKQTLQDAYDFNEMSVASQTGFGPASNSRLRARTWKAPKALEPKKQLPPRQFTPLPRPLSQLLPMLLENHLVAKEVPRKDPPRFRGFDEAKTCVYHMGEEGHDVNNCLVLKNKVENLIDRGMLNFKEPEPSVHQNPLSEHRGVNMIEEEDVGATAKQGSSSLKT